jgi:photosynthetic reaction center H subunit
MAIMGSLDIAQIALYATRRFFAGLAFYLQRKNMREGYPLVTDGGKRSANQGLFPAPEPKVFDLPHGQGSRTVADNKPERELALRQTEIWNGAPFEPTGDPMVDGVGPAARADRADKPDLTSHGTIKIRPLKSLTECNLAIPKNDPCAMPVIVGDGMVAGTVHDLWVDRFAQLIRYIEVDVTGAGKRLLPMTLA